MLILKILMIKMCAPFVDLSAYIAVFSFSLLPRHLEIENTACRSMPPHHF
jgi:hypothetical protein